MGENEESSGQLASPRPSSMIESLRGVGYTAATAIADLIDNSIAAGARRVVVRMVWEGPHSRVIILDDGRGMTNEELVTAMRCGSRNPNDARAPSDLGRFGLGLKTASFSQCRRLTVASRRAGASTAIRRWDIDHVVRTDDWWLLDGTASGSESHVLALSGQESGTLVLWEGLDRLLGMTSESEQRIDQEGFTSIAARVRAYLGMVFHRFLAGPRPRIEIYLNGDDAFHRLDPWDPFMEAHPSTLCLGEEAPRTAAGSIFVRAFLLPSKDSLDASSQLLGAGPDGWTAQQGFYVYRNARMVVAGSWLGLPGGSRPWTKEEPFRLARLQLDFENSVDVQWGIDIRKSTARPPATVQRRLVQLAEVARARSRTVIGRSGPRQARGAPAPVCQAWQRRGAAPGSYSVNREHPVVKMVLDRFGDQRAEVEALLRILEETVPVDRVSMQEDERQDASPGPFGGVASTELLALARSIYGHHRRVLGLQPAEALDRLRTCQPFCDIPGMQDALDNLQSAGEEG